MKMLKLIGMRGGGRFCTLISAIVALSASFGAFAEDAYIQSYGAQSVNTGYHASGKTKISVDFQMTEIKGGKDCVIGHYNAGATVTCLIYCPNTTSIFAELKDGTHEGIAKMFKTGSTTEYAGSDLARHTIVIDAPGRRSDMYDASGNPEAYYEFPESWTYNNTSTWPLLLFGASADTAGTPKQTVKAKIYGVKIWETENGVETLIHDFVPCIKGRDAGFYDEKTGEFRYGKGQGELVCGGDGVKTIPDDGYLQSSGSQYFNTGYYMNPNSRIEVDFQYPVAATRNFLFGTYGDDAGINAFMWNDGTPKQYKFHLKDGAYTGAANLNTGIQCSDTNRFTAIMDIAAQKCSMQRNGYERWTGKVNDTKYTLNNNGNWPLVLFGSANSAAGDGKSGVSARIYSAKIYEKQQNGTYAIVKEFVPYVKDGTAGFLEKQTGVFKAVDGISYGGSIESDRCSYIENDGATVLNLNYYANMKSRIEVDYQCLNPTATKVIFGAWERGQPRYCCWNNGSHEVIFNFSGVSGNAWQSGTGETADDKRHTAVVDLKNHALAYITGGVTNNVAVNAGAQFNTTDKSTDPMGVFSGINNGTTSMVSKSRVYAVRIYEDDELVHEFLPYTDGTTNSLKDVKTGYVATKLTSSMKWPTICGVGVDGAERWIVKPEDATVNVSGSVKLKAVAAGAVKRYKWTKNDEAIEGGANGELTVSWEKHSSADLTDTYTVTPVYDVFGVATDGESKTVEVTNAPLGLMVILR